MSAEVSFTKRAAAELSRCFNGLTINRAANSSNPIATASVPSSTNSPKRSTASSTGSRSGPSTSSSTHSTSSTRSSSSFPLNISSRKAPPPPIFRKTSLARRKNFLLSLRKPLKLEDLVRDFNFLHYFFSYFPPKERTVLAQVCIYWRDILYNDSHFWKGLVMVINCNDLKRVGRTPSPPPLQSSGHQTNESLPQSQSSSSSSVNNNNNNLIISHSNLQSRRKASSTSNSSSAAPPLSQQQQQHPLLLDGSDSVRNNLYMSIEQRGLDSICLNGATDSDIIDFASKVSPSVMRKITSGFLRTSSVTDKGLEIFLASLNQSLKHLELSGCNEITDNGLWAGLVPNLESLVITDCINIADETVGAITQVLPGLKELTLQAYHVTDSAMSYFGPTALRVNLRVLHLEHCWEIGNQGILSIAHGLPNLTSLSLSGCSKVTDDAIEVIAEQLRHLSSLNLSWCSRITDASLEYIACDLADSLKELILDRCVHVTDIGLGYAATMGRLSVLSLRWCPQIRDFGIQTLCSMKSLKSLSLSGCPQLTVSGLSCLVQIHSLTEVELTNCPAATIELIRYLSDHLPPSTTIIP